MVAITALGNRVFILASNSTSLEYRRCKKTLEDIQRSFRADVTRVPSLSA